MHISSDEYHFNTASLKIENATNLIIHFDVNVTLWFEITAGVHIQQCTNLTINGNGVDVDYDPPPFLQLTVTNISTVHDNNSSGRGSGRGSKHNTTQPRAAVVIFQSDENFVREIIDVTFSFIHNNLLVLNSVLI